MDRGEIVATDHAPIPEYPVAIATWMRRTVSSLSGEVIVLVIAVAWMRMADANYQGLGEVC